MKPSRPPEILVDADACPVKAEVMRVARRCGWRVTFVANTRMRVPDGGELVVVGDELDAADRWIAARIESDDIVVTGDLQLAANCLAGGALVVTPVGRILTEANVGPALATRDLLADLRGSGTVTGGPPPFKNRDRSRFLQSLDQLVQQARRRRRT